MPKTRIAREKEIVEKMIAIYCRGNGHGRGQLCPGCAELLDYACKRLELCRFGEDKKFCKHCPVHCYNKEMRAQIRTVMRYSGPRIMLYHPVAAVEHLVSSVMQRVGSK
ncbi:hypothetical protein D3C75_904530 [compost metagenome]